MVNEISENILSGAFQTPGLAGIVTVKPLCIEFSIDIKFGRIMRLGQFDKRFM